MKQLTVQEWDVLMYVASYIAGYDHLPTKQKVVYAGLGTNVVDGLITHGFLLEQNGGLKPVLEKTKHLA